MRSEVYLLPNGDRVVRNRFGTFVHRNGELVCAVLVDGTTWTDPDYVRQMQH